MRSALAVAMVAAGSLVLRRVDRRGSAPLQWWGFSFASSGALIEAWVAALRTSRGSAARGLESSDLVQNDPRRDAVILVVVENPLLDGDVPRLDPTIENSQKRLLRCTKPLATDPAFYRGTQFTLLRQGYLPSKTRWKSFW